MEILGAIGQTSLVRLRRVVPADCAEIHVKLEWENPTGSMKDRLFAGTSSGANVLAAIAVGRRLGPEGKVVTLMCDSGLKYLHTDLYQKR